MVAIASPVFTVFNQGQVVPGGKIYTYITGTTTPLTTYQDAALTVPHANPIVANANGQAVIYLATTNNAKFVLRTADEGLIDTIDPVYPAAIATGGTSGVEAEIPSAATTDIGSAGVNIIKVTGTTGITSFGSSANISNPIYYIRFTGALTITNSANIVCPGGSNITTANGSAIIAQYLGDDDWQILFVQSASGGSFLQVSNNLSDVANAATALSNLGGAPLASPALTGNPTAPTPSPGDNDTSIATTAFVTAAVAASAWPGTNNTLGVGNYAILSCNDAGGVASGSTIAGSSLYTTTPVTSGGGFTATTNAPSGTWRNVHGEAVNFTRHGLFQRTA